MNELLLNLYIGYGYPEGLGMPDGLKKTANALSDSIIKNDLDKVLEILHPDNKLSRKAFEHLFQGRLKLPKTVKGTNEVLADFLARCAACG